MSDVVGSVKRVQPDTSLTQTADEETEARAWVLALSAGGRRREEAAERLHALLLRAARFELLRRRGAWNGSGETVDDLAMQSADSALVAILAKLDGYRFDSRFTTWAYKFAILEAAQIARRRSWQERELPIDPNGWDRLSPLMPDLAQDHAIRERLRLVTAAIQSELSPHQREVLTALVLHGVPIDVLAERLNTTRGALYKTLHDARQKLREVVGSEGDD